MANPQHVEILQQGVEPKKAWRRAYPRTALDLRGAQLSGGFLGEPDLRGLTCRTPT